MAYTKEQIKQNYPLPVYNYRVEIAGEPIAFSNVSGLNIEVGTHVYKESPVGATAGPVVMRMPAQLADLKITLKKGLVRKKSLPVLYAWISTVQVNQIDKKDILIHLLDEAGSPVITWNVLNAFPVKLEAPTFDATSNDAAIESMELMADNILVSES
jgi:phage tail-like protein